MTPKQSSGASETYPLRAVFSGVGNVQGLENGMIAKKHVNLTSFQFQNYLAERKVNTLTYCINEASLSLRLSGKSEVWLDGAESGEQLLGLLIADGHGDNDIVLGLKIVSVFHVRRRGV
jgi:hypothetical protein